MKNRWLFIGVVVLLVLGYLAWQKKQAPAKAGRVSGDTVQSLLPFDINSVGRFEFVTPSSTSTLVRQDGQWAVSELWNYPADFAKVSDPLRLLANLQVGPVVRGGTELLDELGLVDDPAKSGEQRPSFLRFFDASGQRLAQLALGQKRTGSDPEAMGQGGGSYVRVDEGPVMLVNEEFYSIPRAPTEWVDNTLLNVAAGDIQSISISSTTSTYTLRSPAADRFELDGLSADQEVAKETASRLFQALASLQLSLVVDPAKPEAELGLEKPEEFQAATRDGVTWVIHLGGSPDGVNRYARCFAIYKASEAPAAPAEGADEAARKAYEQAKKDYDERVAQLTQDVAARTALFSKWTYVLPNYTCNTLLTPRDQLVKVKEKPVEPAPSPNAAPPAVASP